MLVVAHDRNDGLTQSQVSTAERLGACGVCVVARPRVMEAVCQYGPGRNTSTDVQCDGTQVSQSVMQTVIPQVEQTLYETRARQARQRAGRQAGTDPHLLACLYVCVCGYAAVCRPCLRTAARPWAAAPSGTRRAAAGTTAAACTAGPPRAPGRRCASAAT